MFNIERLCRLAHACLQFASSIVGLRIPRVFSLCVMVLCLGAGTSVRAEYVSTESKFFNSLGEAQAACEAQPVQYVCNPDGSMYFSYCNTIAQPIAGGMTQVGRVEWSKRADGGQCYYTYYANLRYTYFKAKDAACPEGTKFVGPGPNDCVDSTFTTTSNDNQEGVWRRRWWWWRRWRWWVPRFEIGSIRASWQPDRLDHRQQDAAGVGHRRGGRGCLGSSGPTTAFRAESLRDWG